MVWRRFSLRSSNDAPQKSSNTEGLSFGSSRRFFRGGFCRTLGPTLDDADEELPVLSDGIAAAPFIEALRADEEFDSVS